MNLRELIRAVAKEDLRDMLTPFAVVIALEIAAKVWDEGYTQRYGTELRDIIVDLAAQVNSL
jgi:hypothetical protein